MKEEEHNEQKQFDRKTKENIPVIASEAIAAKSDDL